MNLQVRPHAEQVQGAICVLVSSTLGGGFRFLVGVVEGYPVFETSPNKKL